MLGLGKDALEVTSSGLTHSCSDSLPQFFCQLTWHGPAHNRRYGNAVVDRNYGVIKLDWSARTMRLAVYSVPSQLGQHSQEQLWVERSLDAPFADVLPPSWSSEDIGLVPDVQTRVALFLLLGWLGWVAARVLRSAAKRLAAAKRQR
jgi:hypothetical protein